MNDQKVFETAKKYENEVCQFLRDICAIPSTSCHERDVVLRIKEEMKKVGFDEVIIDPMGNIIGRIGDGPRVIAMDSHIDCVDVGSMSEWKHDPFKGKLENGVIWGRGATDQKGGMAGMVYGVKIIKELGLLSDYTLYVVGSVQEEDCDGLCWQYIYNEDIVKNKLIKMPECVVITEPTNLQIYRGHRGRMEITVTTYGVSCHGSAPERGKNAVYMMSKIALGVEKLNEKLKHDDFLGKGTVCVSCIECKTPSYCAVPDECTIHLDRRLTAGETDESAVKEVDDMVKELGFKEGEYKIEILNYAVPSYTNLEYPTRKYYPTWVLPEDHPVNKAAVATFKGLFNEEPVVDKWVFSTNGIATMGMFKIPTVGFGPANEIYAHTVNDQCPVMDLVKAAAFYALFPTKFLAETK